MMLKSHHFFVSYIYIRRVQSAACGMFDSDRRQSLVPIFTIHGAMLKMLFNNG